MVCHFTIPFFSHKSEINYIKWKYSIILEFIQVIYTDYFSRYIKDWGVPPLSKEQWQRLLNIVYMEALVTATSECGDRSIKHYQTYRHTKSLNELTGRKKPQYLMGEMLKLSSHRTV